LRDDANHMVQCTVCPLKQYWEQEQFIIQCYNNEYPASWLDTPCWIKQGMRVLRHIRESEDEEVQRRVNALGR